MSRSPKTKLTSVDTDSPAETSPPPSLPVGRVRRGLRAARDRFFRPQSLFATACLVSLVVFAPRLYQRLPDLSQQERHRVRASQVRVTPPPHWVPHDLVRQIVAEERWEAQSRSVLEESLAEEMAAGFSRHPWVERVTSVRKEPPNVVRVEVIYRRPVALVEVGDGRYYPVAADAVLLPPADFSRADLARYPVVRNVASLPQGPAGTPWGDVVVAGAARLAEHLMRPHDRERTHWEFFRFATIEAPERHQAEETLDDLTFVLRTAEGSEVVWGRAPGTGHPGELSAEQKIGRLQQYLADYGGFTHPNGPLEIDIRHWQEITQRLLPTRTTQARRFR